MSIFTRTTNKALAVKGAGKPTTDLFFNIGSARQAQERVKDLFDKSCLFDMNTTAAILCWVRDIRSGGAGERTSFRTCLKELILSNPELALKVINLIPKIGRFDDLRVAIGTTLESQALNIWKTALDEGNLLAFKWVNIKKDTKLRNLYGMNGRDFRKFIAGARKGKIVEDLMCNNQWSEIKYEHVPSVASSRYGKSFGRHDEVRYSTWKNSKETKANAAVLYPYDVYRTAKHDDALATKLWDNLPKLETGKNILPMADVSGSMSCRASGSVTCLDVSVSLATYLAQNNTGIFRNKILTFSENPTIVTLPEKSNSILTVFSFLESVNWGMNTDFEKAFRLILVQAKRNNVSQKDMPEIILVLSDMQFDQATSVNPFGTIKAKHVKTADLWGKEEPEDEKEDETTMHGQMSREFKLAGYKLPTIVYWNLNAAYDNYPTLATKGVAMVSGFSPNIMKSVVKDGIVSPDKVMEDAISKYREMLETE